MRSLHQKSGLIFLVAVLATVIFAPIQVLAQNFKTAKYGGDFLSVGAGARALGMGSAQSAMASDVTAAYWNAAGLSAVENMQVTYMHSERFNGIVGYDYGAFALPVRNGQGVVALSFFRQGVDGIKNTLNAWDPDRDLPRSNPEDYITEFSTADVAFFLSYAQRRSDRLSWGATAKVLNSRLGPFAEAWGYSLDLALQYSSPWGRFGVNLMDITTMMKFWDVHPDKLKPLQDAYGEAIPGGQNERVLPTVKVGYARQWAFDNFQLQTAADVDMRFEGRRQYYWNLGDISFEPHLGAELTYKKSVSLRAGVTDFGQDFNNQFTASPTLGAGLMFKAIEIDYGFTSFAGVTSDLGFTHRLSLMVQI